MDNPLDLFRLRLTTPIVLIRDDQSVAEARSILGRLHRMANCSGPPLSQDLGVIQRSTGIIKNR